MKDVFNSALEGIHVIDLTEERGLYAGKMLADFGADVILVENPGGSKARWIGPFKDDIPGQENSLYHLNFNTNKRSITLNIDKPAGRKIFKQLVKGADVVLEDFDVGRMQSLGLDYPKLRKLNSGIIVASITGFGQTGPYSTFKSSDIVSFAMGGLMNINGSENEPPVVAPCDQSYQSASVTAVFGIIGALFLRISTGKGQLVDTSSHEVAATLTGGILSYSNTSQIARRAGSQFGIAPGRIYPCKDGHVHILIIRPNHWLGFLELLGNPDIMMGEEWHNSAFRNRNADLIDAHIIEFTMSHTKMEITELCQSKGLPCTPVNSPVDFYQDSHIKDRGFFTQIEHPIIGCHPYPSPPCRLSATPCAIKRPAPLLGEHNHEVYSEQLGYGDQELEDLKSNGVI